MIRTLFRFVLRIIAVLLVLFCILMLVPRALSKISPGSAPIGYYFVAADFIAVKVGLEKIVDLTPAVPGDIEEIKNIEYKNAGGKSLQLDLYRPRNLSGPAPLLVFIHGGGWSGGDRKDYLVYLLSFARKGYVTATISYRLLKDGTYPACVEDVCDAFRWFYMNGSEYGYDPERIAAIGGSAGAHLAMLAAYGWKKEGADSSSQRPYSIKAVVEIYGPTDLTTEYARNHNLVTRFLARSYKDDPDLYTEASPVHWAGSSAPPTLILHGTADQLVPVSQADLLKEKLDSLGIPAPIFKLPLWPHTMDLVSRVNLYIQDRISDFLEKYLKPTGTGPQ